VRVGVHRRTGAALAAHRGSAAPRGVQGGARRPRSPPCPVHAGVWVARHRSGPQGRERTAHLLGQHGAGRALAICFLQARAGLLGGGMVPAKQDRGFRDGPCASGVAALGPCGPRALPGGGLCPRDEATRRAAIRAAGAALEGRHRREEPAAQDFPTTGGRLEPVPRLGLGLVGRVDQGKRHGAQQGRRVSQQRASDCDALGHRGRGNPRRPAVSLGGVGALLLEGGAGRLTGRMLDGGQPRRPCARERPAAPEQVPRGAHRGGRDVRLGAPAAAEPPGNGGGIDLLVFGFASMEGVPVAGLAEDEGQARWGTQGSEPRPGAETCDRDDEGSTRRRKSREKRLRASVQVLVQPDLAVLVAEAEGQGAGRQGDAAVRRVLVGVASPAGSASWVVFPLPADHCGLLRRGPQ
jgi:hypothetical protein